MPRPAEPVLTPSLCVVIHDVADQTLAACERLLAAIETVATVPLTHLAVPRYHGDPASAALRQWLTARQARGDELALHGYSHRDESAPQGWLDRLRREHYTRSEGEFWALDAPSARLRLRAGMAWFERNAWPLHGFVAPAWLLGPGAWCAVRETPLRYTSTLRHIHLLPGAARITSQSVVYSTSAAWRRQSSVVWAGLLGAALRSQPVLRLELHPCDADHPQVRRSWQRLLERELQRRQALTVVQLTERWRAAQITSASESDAPSREEERVRTAP